MLKMGRLSAHMTTDEANTEYSSRSIFYLWMKNVDVPKDLTWFSRLSDSATQDKTLNKL
jgi:hypothetical protein